MNDLHARTPNPTSPPPPFKTVIAIAKLTPEQTGLQKSELFRLRLGLHTVKQIRDLNLGYADAQEALHGLIEDTFALIRENREIRRELMKGTR
jgi:hypothetical protein